MDKSWKIIIADDEPEIHALTRMVLNDYTFEGRKLEFLSAYSGAQTMEVMAKNPDTALLLLDVVMEDDDTGLEVVRYVREHLHNNLVRIILRTGQPGQAPERKVVTEYDINDYKEKTELTIQKLFTTVTASLRAYRDLVTIQTQRQGLERIIKASHSLLDQRSPTTFAQKILTQMHLLLVGSEDNDTDCELSGLVATRSNGSFRIIAGVGDYTDDLDLDVKHIANKSDRRNILQAIERSEPHFSGETFSVLFHAGNAHENVIFFKCKRSLSSIERNILRIFANNVSIAFNNVYLNCEIEETQQEVLYTIGEILESRSHEMRNHVKRVAEFCRLMGRQIGLNSEQVELLRQASTMHDLGKIAIPDQILNKPGRLTPPEYEIMKTHTTIGYDILRKSERTLLKSAAIIAQQHHEHWNGAGYPQGLKGDDIHIFGRITLLADVFDALSHRRIYKSAWSLNKILDNFKSERGRQLDPELTDLFFDNLDDFIKINQRFPDELPA